MRSQVQNFQFGSIQTPKKSDIIEQTSRNGRFIFMLMETGSSGFSLSLSIFVIVIINKLQGFTFHIETIAWYKALPYYWARAGPAASIMVQTR